MLFYTGLMFLVIAVSLDGFGVGVTYGIRKIHVPFIALAIIMFCSGFVVMLSMTIGNLLSAVISPNTATILGGSILVFIGLFALYNIFSSSDHFDDQPIKESKNNPQLHKFKTVLTKPVKADIDRSGIISIQEALLLGLALALDAFGAGIGASMLGYSPLLTTFLIAFMSGLFLFSGIQVGLLLSKNRRLQRMTFIPPILLILLGVINIVFR